MDGLLVLKKEKGYTSHDTVSRLRGILHMRQIGHLGTLDPDAEGVLPVLLGRATRLAPYLPDEEKVYRAGLLLGVRTDTQDAAGKLLQRTQVNVSEKQLRAAILSFLGNSFQQTPMYSARKIDGKKLVDLARAGKEVERPSLPIEIREIEILSVALPRAEFLVRCSKGTYIRALCHDIGEKLGCGGIMEYLVREEACGFGLSEAHTLGEIQFAALTDRVQEWILPMERPFQRYPSFVPHPEAVKAARNGNRLAKTDGRFLAPGGANGQGASLEVADSACADFDAKVYSGPVRLVLPNGEFLGLVRSEAGSRFLKVERLLSAHEEDAPYTPPASVVSLGKFDGFHRGHQQLIHTLTDLACEESLRPIVFAFSMPGQPSLETPQEKRDSARVLGIRALLDCPFNDTVRTMEAETFLKEILIGRLGMKHLVVGPDCCFGYQRRGNVAYLRQMAPLLGFTLHVVEKVRYEGEEISSTRTRKALMAGDMVTVQGCLGHPFRVEQRVSYGWQLASDMGFPTVNQFYPEGKIAPPAGVYASLVHLPDGQALPAMSNLGVKPTFSANGPLLLETHILDYSGDLYGQILTVDLLSFLRPETRFADEDALARQIREDREQVRAFFTSNIT